MVRSSCLVEVVTALQIKAQLERIIWKHLFKEVLLLLPLSSRRSASSQIVVRVRAIKRQKEEQIKIERVLCVLL